MSTVSFPGPPRCLASTARQRNGVQEGAREVQLVQVPVTRLGADRLRSMEEEDRV